MSVILVLVGQCGNQLGEAIATTLSSTCTFGGPSPGRGRASSGTSSSTAPPPARKGPFFASDGCLRAVMVDAEPKVVDAVAARHPALFRREAVVTGDSGRGNSWAAGYNGLVSRAKKGGGASDGTFGTPSPIRRGRRDDSRPTFVVNERDHRERDSKLLAHALRAIHNESSRCEDGGVEAIIVVHSLAGGTGSGFGSALVENLRWYFTATGGGAPEDGTFDITDDDDHGDDGAGGGFMRGRHATTAANEPLPGCRGAPKPPSVLDEDEWSAGVYGTRRVAQSLVSVSVAPRRHGETTVQSFNMALTLRAVRPMVDAAIVLRNDVPGISNDAWTQSGVNQYFATSLVSVLQGGLQFGAVGELIAKVCPLRSHNLLTLLPVSAGATRLKSTGPRATTHAAAKTSADAGVSLDKTPSVSPHLHGFHQSSVSAVLVVTQTQPPPAQLVLDDFLHPSVRPSADTLLGVIRTPVAAAASGGGAGAGRSGRAAVGAGSGGAGSREAAVRSLPTVLVLNQASELARTLVFPALNDAYSKVEAKAFLQGFVSLAPVAPRLFPDIRMTRAWADRHRHPGDDAVNIAGLALRHAVSDVAEALLKYPGTA